MSLAEAHRETRDFPATQAVARRAVAVEPLNGPAWIQLIDAAAASGPETLEAALAEFDAIGARDARLAIGVAERVAGLATGADDPVLRQAMRWLEVVPSDADLAASRDVARVRVLAAAERWPEATRAAQSILVTHGRSAATLKLRAEILSWAGHHASALLAYDDYLAEAPGDVEAWRQQARVAGWSGRYDTAQVLYDKLLQRFPSNPAIAAEARAKVAFFEGRWTAGRTAYREWLSFEPENEEAQFELAETLRAGGHIPEADNVLERLAADFSHRLAFTARERASFMRRPTVGVISERRSANGYQGRRLLDLTTNGATLSNTLGLGGQTTLAIRAASVQANSGDQQRLGYQVGVQAAHRLRSSLHVDGSWQVWDVGRAASISHGGVALSWTASDRVTVGAGFDRELVLDTIGTVDSRLAGTGAFGGLRVASPTSSIDTRTSWQSLSDGNSRRRVTISAGRVLSHRFDDIRLVAWAEALSYRQRTDGYFSPSGFLRLDAGAEVHLRRSHGRASGMIAITR